MVPPRICFERDRLGVCILLESLRNTWTFAEFLSVSEVRELRATRACICVATNPIWKSVATGQFVLPVATTQQ
jgi:hypothetical protein